MVVEARSEDGVMERIAASSVKKLFAGKGEKSPASTTGPLGNNVLGAGCIAGSLIFRR